MTIEDGVKYVNFSNTKVQRIECNASNNLDLNFFYSDGSDQTTVDLTNIRINGKLNINLTSDSQNNNLILPEDDSEVSTVSLRTDLKYNLNISNFDFLNNMQKHPDM